LPCKKCQVQRDRTGDGGIQRFDLALHRKSQDYVAFRARELTDALALAPDDQTSRSRQMTLSLRSDRFPILIQTYDPDIFRFESLNRLREI